MSPADEGRAAFQIELPPGATLRQTDAVVQQVTQKLNARPEVTSVYAAVGGQSVNQANVYADMVPKDPDPPATDRGGARGPARAGEPARADRLGRLGAAERRGRHRVRRRSGHGQPSGPLAHRLDHGRAGRHHHRRRGSGRQPPALGQEPARRRASGPRRRRRVHPGNADRLRHRLHLGPAADVRRAGAAVQKLLQADRHPRRPAARRRRRLHRSGDRRQELLHVGPDRGADADGDRGQELDLAGRLHHRRRAQRHDPSRGHHGRRPQAGAPHPDDHLRHGGGHGAHRHGPGGRRRVPLAHGHRRPGGSDLFDLPVTALHPGLLHHHRRHRRLGPPDAGPDVRWSAQAGRRQPPRRPQAPQGLREVHEGRPAQVVVARVQRGVADPVVVARRDGRRIFVQQVANADRGRPAVRAILDRGVVQPVVRHLVIVVHHGGTILVVVVAIHALNPVDAVTDAPLIPGVGHVERSGEFRVVQHALGVFQTVFLEQLARDFRVLGDSQVSQDRTRTNVLAVANRVVQALHVVRGQIHVAVVHGQLGRIRITLDQTAEAGLGREIGLAGVVATVQDFTCASARHAVFDFDLVVVDGEGQITPARGQRRLEHQADGHVGRGFSSQTGVSAACRDHGNAAGRLEVVGQAVDLAVLVDIGGLVLGRQAVATVEVAGLEARGGADELLKQRRGAIGGAIGCAERHPVDRTIDQAGLVGRVVAVGVVVRVAERGVQRQFLGERLVTQQRRFDFAEDFPHRVGAARDSGGRVVVGVADLRIEGGRVVDFRLAPFRTEEAHHLAGRQVEQRAVQARADDLLFELGDALDRTEDVVDPILRQHAADRGAVQGRGGDAARVVAQLTADKAAGAVADDIQAFRQTIRQELLAGVFRTRLGIAGRQVIAPFRDEEVTLDADDVAVEALLLVRTVIAEADEGADADGLALAQALVPREGAPGQVSRDQRAALGVVQGQLAVAGLRRLALVDQEFAVHFSIAERVQLIAAFTVDGGDFDRRDQRLVQHRRVIGVAGVQVGAGAANALEAHHAIGDGRVRTPTVERGRRRTDRADAGRVAGADRVDGRAVRTGTRDRVALRLARHRVDVVFAVQEAVRLATREFTVAQGQFIALIALDRTGGAPAVATSAGRQREAARAARAVGFQRQVALGFKGQAFEVLAGDDVDHAGDGVRAIQRRGAVAQHFDAVDHRRRQNVQVSRADRTARTGGRDATTVQQHQGAARPQAAQANGVGTWAAIGDVAAVGVVDLRGAGRYGSALQCSGGRVEAGQRGFLTRHDLGRRRGVEIVATNARADDDDF
uniref:Efflux RND transporter permease subunit n=1 Tax=Parastrongyloides trichosuri TaxID=131310 RepID=A0A0N4ZJK5_PARTI